MTQIDKATGYPAAEGLVNTTGESVTAGFRDMNRGYLSRIRRLRMDNAAYFLAAPFLALLDAHDIKPEYSSPIRPQSNSGIERFHLTAEGGVRAQLSVARLPYAFWFLALLHWLFNYARLPT